MDTGANWWTASEINHTIQDGLDRINDELEVVWGTASTTIGAGTASATITITDIATDVLRLEDIRWNDRRLVFQSVEELDNLQEDWRDAGTGVPIVVRQDDLDTFVLWPPPGTAGTLTMEYPATVTLSTNTSTSPLPPWTRYAVIPYCAMRAYLRQGPNTNPQKALRWKQRFESEMGRLRSVYRAYLPTKHPRLRPGGEYEGELTQPSRVISMPTPATSTRLYDEVPTGTVNGTNTTFTLTNAPNPGVSLKLWEDGVLMKSTTHYTLSSSTVTFVSAFKPITGQALFASYRYVI